MSGGGIWAPHLPLSGRPPVLSEILVSYFQSRPFDGVEIGVHRGATLRILRATPELHIRSFVGVDPYLGDSTDPYVGAYWSSPEEANMVYEKAAAIYLEAGGTLVRLRSDEWFGSLPPDAAFDFILVDGDHRYGPALADLRRSWSRLRPGGLLMVDDYAHLHHPDVTSAIRTFVNESRESLGRIGYRIIPFRPDGYPVPISLMLVYIEKPSKSGSPESRS